LKVIESYPLPSMQTNFPSRCPLKTSPHNQQMLLEK
jgi:hypothetical protein